ncbi:VCBS repeat-containing protein [bacterium]|nr:VCBS repeat-containing protein [bacterium]
MGMSFSCRSDDSEEPDEPETEASQIAEMIAVEELILKLTPELQHLEDAVFDCEFPNEHVLDHLFNLVKGITLEPSEIEEASLIVSTQWRGSKEGDRFWSKLLDQIESFEETRFYFIDGAFPSGLKSEFVSKVGFEGKALSESGKVLSITGKQELVWSEINGRWKITDWKQSPLTVHQSDHALYVETLEEALPHGNDLQVARHSQHERNIVDLFTKDKFSLTKQIYADYLDLDSTFQHPGLSVVDYNDDGWDDLYVMGRWGANQMLHNNGDGTFTDVAAKIGLNVKGLCTSAIFADFDNDGDQDVFIGRSLERSLFLTNEGGRFVDRSKQAFGNFPLPYLVSTISAVDYDQDGLLDVYLGLYAPPNKDVPVAKWAKQFFPPAMAKEIISRSGKSHRYLNRFGPPNLLFKNLGGGRFTVSPAAQDLAEWLDTYAAIWSDFDQDGDPDVYVCNDFGPDHLYQNNDGRFTDVTEEFAGKKMQGFGMGASWGDYDRDGKLDLYVSNMFSKAGRRIADTIDGIDPRIPHSANGNLLFKNEGTHFIESSNSLQVAKVGWAYGAQFVDIDNDGWLDLYSASGFYTAPKEIANNKDL